MQQDLDAKPIVIIGTGLAGYTLAREFRKLNKEAPLLLITADDGCAYSKPMLSTGYAKGKTAEALETASAGDMAAQLDAVIRTGVRVDRIHLSDKRIQIGSEMIDYDKLVLASGAAPVHPELDGTGVSEILSINDMADYRYFRQRAGNAKRVLIIGAGLIGCEYANDLLAGGYVIDVVAPSETVLPGLVPSAVGQALERAMCEAGINLHLGRVVKGVDKGNEGEPPFAVLLDDNHVLTADLVLAATGLQPVLGLAKDSGLETRRGVVVDDCLQTSNEHVYALGDCSEVGGECRMYVMPLMTGARALARTLAGNTTAVDYGVMPVIVKTPLCPVVVVPPGDMKGHWEVETQGNDVEALYLDESGALKGFALSGACTGKRQSLIKQMSEKVPV